MGERWGEAVERGFLLVGINKRCVPKRLQLNPDEIENSMLQKTMSRRRLQGLDLGLHVGSAIIAPVDVVPDLSAYTLTANWK